jgi:hypothetical protein
VFQIEGRAGSGSSSSAPALKNPEAEKSQLAQESKFLRPSREIFK